MIYRLVQEQAQSLYYGVNNLIHIYNLHQAYFSLALNDLSPEDCYAKFTGIYEELIFTNDFLLISQSCKSKECACMQPSFYLSCLQYLS